MLQQKFPGWRQCFRVALLLTFLSLAALTPTRPAHAQDSPLPTPPSPLASPTSGAAPTSPQPTPTSGEAGQPSQPISTTAATTAAPSSLAGTALTRPDTIVVIVLTALVVVGGVVWRQRSGR